MVCDSCLPEHTPGCGSGQDAESASIVVMKGRQRICSAAQREGEVTNF